MIVARYCINGILSNIRNIPGMFNQNGKVYYAVAVGKQTGIYHTWAECKTQIQGVENPKYKKFFSYKEAEDFVKSWRHGSYTPKNPVEKNSFNEHNFNHWASSDSIKGDRKFKKIPQSKRYPKHLRHSLSHVFKKEEKQCRRRHSAGYVFENSAPKQFSDSRPENSFLNMKNEFPNRYFEMTYSDDEVTNVSGHSDSTDIVVLPNNNAKVVTHEVDQKDNNNAAKETVNEVKTCEIQSVQIQSNSVDSNSNNENNMDEIVSQSSTSNNENTKIIESRTESNGGNNFEQVAQLLNGLKDNFEMIDLPNVNKEVYMKSVAKSFETIVNFLSDGLKDITSSVVSYINASCGVHENVSSTVSSDCRMSNTISGDVQVPSNESTNIGELREKIEKCERKVDACFGHISTVLTSLTEAKDDLRELKNILFKNSNLLEKIPSTSLSCISGNIRNQKFHSVSADQSDNSHSTIIDALKLEASDFDNSDFDYCATKKRKSSVITPDSDGSNVEGSIKREKTDYVGFTIDNDDYVIVYTDGACFSNGRDDAKAGIGIWFGEGNPLNISKPLSGGPPTNNNAEIQAARVAIELALGAGISKLKIVTDSEFVVNCATKWMESWKKKGWVTGSKKPVKNRAELEKLDNVMSKLSVRWEKVQGHSGIIGNEIADRLANDGAALYVRK